MDRLKRWTICVIANHRWAKAPYPAGSDGEAGGTFLRCLRCGKEDHDAGTVARGGGSMF